MLSTDLWETKALFFFFFTSAERWNFWARQRSTHYATWAKFPACLIKRWTKSGLGQGAWNVQTLRHSAGKIMQLTVRQMGKEGQRLRHEEPRQFPLFLHLEQVTLRMTRRGPPWAAPYTQTMEERRCPCDTLWVNLSRSKANISGPHVASQYCRERQGKRESPRHKAVDILIALSVSQLCTWLLTFIQTGGNHLLFPYNTVT